MDETEVPKEKSLNSLVSTSMKICKRLEFVLLNSDKELDSYDYKTRARQEIVKFQIISLLNQIVDDYRTGIHLAINRIRDLSLENEDIKKEIKAKNIEFESNQKIISDLEKEIELLKQPPLVVIPSDCQDIVDIEYMQFSQTSSFCEKQFTLFLSPRIRGVYTMVLQKISTNKHRLIIPVISKMIDESQMDLSLDVVQLLIIRAIIFKDLKMFDKAREDLMEAYTSNITPVSSHLLHINEITNVFILKLLIGLDLHDRNFTDAKEHYELMIDGKLNIDAYDRNSIAIDYFNLGMIHIQTNTLDHAIHAFQDSLGIFSNTQKEKSSAFVVNVKNQMAMAYFKQGAIKKAYNLYREVLTDAYETTVEKFSSTENHQPLWYVAEEFHDGTSVLLAKLDQETGINLMNDIIKVLPKIVTEQINHIKSYPLIKPICRNLRKIYEERGMNGASKIMDLITEQL